MNPKELLIEEEYLKKTIDEIQAQINVLKTGLDVEETSINEFNRYVFKEMGNMDSVEIRSNLLSSAMEEQAFLRKSKYLKKLYRIRSNPYFGRIDITSDRDYKIYLGITYLEKDNDHLIYDWRSPVANLFYDSEVGSCSYIAPEGQIDCILHKKRQYKITNGKIVNIFDNDLNINDDVLQQVLSNESSDKMKNIVNTIQKEQNNVIRNITNKNLIVEGIAGSGKTSVALHRIAYLLYKIPNLSSDNVLIFSPNNIFSIYISNVLPELGEDNTLITTFHEFASKYIKEYWRVEPYSDFLARYYQNVFQDNDLIKFKLSDEIIPILENYANTITKLCRFTNDIIYQEEVIDKNELNELLTERFNKFNLFLRFDHIAEKINNRYFRGRKQDKVRIKALLLKNINITTNIKDIYKDFFDSQEFLYTYNKHFNRNENIKNLNKKVLNYEDSALFIYLKFLLMDIPYKVSTKLVVIDESQDYTMLQYKIIKMLFRNSNFTILGDVNQTINPYYKYDSMEILSDIFNGVSKYIELNKTYRSSKEIIDYSNKVLGLTHACAVRKEINTPVIEYEKLDYDKLVSEIKRLKEKYSNVAIITKSSKQADEIYENIKDKVEGIDLIKPTTERFNKELIIIPTYIAKGLEFDSVIIINDFKNEKYLYYVAITRSQHELVIFNSTN